MKVATIGLLTALAVVGTAATAQVRTRTPPAAGVTTGAATSSTGTTMGSTAGSAAAMENSAANPSGNSLMNSSPSGSTVAPAVGAPGVGGRR
jgi:hypothetical protein